MEEISFTLDPHIVEAEQNLELQADSIIKIRTDINKDISYWKYNLV